MINKVNAILNQVQGLLNDMNNGKGTIGKFFADESLYRKADSLVTKADQWWMKSTKARAAWANW